MTLHGTVIKGDGIAGKLFGTPTANCVFDVAHNIAVGVYAGRVKIGVAENEQLHAAICVGEKFEAHLLDFSGDLVGQKLEIDVLERMSDLVPWESEEQMRKKIHDDIAAVWKYFVNEDAKRKT